jgi:curved DNA-binding protein CbpA
VRARLVPQQNAYQRLSVNAASTSEAVKAAYIDLVKRYHPDRATQGLEVVATELRAIFEAVKEAYDLIATAPLRATYDKQMREGQSQTGKLRTEEAQTLVKMGEVLLKKRDFAAALQKLRKAVELDSNGDSLAALAWGLMSDPGTSPAAKDEAASLIQKALRAPGLSARTYYVAGVLWRTKDPDSAADAFRKSLELEPNHSDASLELRLLEMRGKSGKGDGAGGVLSGLLFGKRKG